MGSALQLQSPTVKGYAADDARGRVIVFTSAGVDIYRISDWTRIAWAAIPNVTCGTMNDNGIYIGTSDAGVWKLPLTVSGASNGSLVQEFGPGAAVSFDSSNIVDISGAGTALAIIAGSTLYFLPTRFVAYTYTGAMTPTGVRTDGTNIAIIGNDGSAVINAVPTADWDDTGNIPLEPVTEALELTFDGDDYIKTPVASSAMGTTFTVKGKITPTSFASTVEGTPRRIVTAWKSTGSSRWAIGFTQDGVFQVYVHDGASVVYATGPTLSVGTEYKFAVTYDGTTLKGYINDALEFSMTTSLIADTADYLRIGIYYESNTGDNARGYKGTMKQISFWNSAQDATEVQDLEPVGTESDLLAYYALDEEAGTTAYDGSDNGNDAPITGATWSGSASAAITAVAFAGDVFFGTDLGIFSYDGSATTNHTSLIGTVKCVKAVWPEPGATASSGFVAYGTSDGSNNGEFGILGFDGAPANRKTESGDVDKCWLNKNANEAIRDITLERYRLVADISPGPNAIAVRRDWSLYAEVTDALGGIQAGSVALTVNGVSVTPSTGAIPDGYAVAYIPGSPSGYAERVTVELSGLDADGNTVCKTWSFVTAAVPSATVTDSKPPNVICTRDIGLSEDEADEVKDGVPVIWLEDIAGPLIVTDAQAKARGTVAIDEVTYHRHIRKMNVKPTDANGLQTRDLRKGQVITMTCRAIGMTAQKCEVLAAQRKLDDKDELTFDLQIAYYEQVQE